MGCRVVPKRRRPTPPRTDHGEHGLGVENVDFLDAMVVAADHGEIGGALGPRPVSVIEVRLRHVVFSFCLHLI
jgi:hypothetical protein